MITSTPNLAPKKWARRRWTYEELCAVMPETNRPTELWDGELIMSPSPFFGHQELVARIYKLLDTWVTRRRLGKVIVSPLDMILAPRRVTQPDVMVVLRDRLGILRDRLHGPADLAVEILSPHSRRRDRLDKRDLYEQHGVREYWLIDPEAQTVEVLHLESGEYALVGRWRPGEAAKSRLLKGFRVDVGGLFAAD